MENIGDVLLIIDFSYIFIIF